MAAEVCLVTGASSGIGRATALELCKAGHVVHSAARRPERMHELRQVGSHAHAMDVTSEEDLSRVVRTILDERHRIDVLINNAGIGLVPRVEARP